MNTKFYFCNYKIEGGLTGIELSSFKRSLLFEEYLNIIPDFITVNLSVNNHISWNEHKKRGLVPKNSHHINMYDDYMKLEEGANYSPANLDRFEIANRVLVSDSREKITLKCGIVLNVVWKDCSRMQLYIIGYSLNNKIVRRDFFGMYGQLAISKVYDNDGCDTQVDVFEVSGKVCLSIMYGGSKAILNICVYDKCSSGVAKIFNNENELVFDWLNSKEIKVGDFYFVDKNRMWSEPLSKLRVTKDINVISTIHSSHLKNSYNLPIAANLNYNYLGIFNNKWLLDAVVVLTPDQLYDIESNFKINSKVVSIPHAKDTVSSRVPFELRDPDTIIMIGRLSEEKQFDHAIAIMKELIVFLPNKKLYIYGEGKLRGYLEDLVREGGLEDSVFLPGYTKDVGAVLEKSSVYLCTSKVEGFPLTLIESLSHGVPVVSYDIKYGPSAMISDSINGYLVERNNINQAVEKLICFFKDKDKLVEMSEQAYLLSDKYHKERVAVEWINLIQGFK